jgi:hypothetical protein
MKLYPDAGEEIPKDLPPEIEPRVRMTVYVDADHENYLVTKRSITGILVMLIICLSDGYQRVRRQLIHQLMAQDWWLQGLLRNSFLKFGICLGHSLGVALDGTALILGDNMSVFVNNIVPSSVLKKKHNAIAYHRVREAIVARIMKFS